ncbi:UNVERIFIED_CONTAM: hypothetical protein GTU68_001661 [Idotea baltica]|nr:hypothetical protein [Idotea baltica]
MVAFLLLETLMLGVFTALDLVLFYLFFEAGLIPMFLIIGIWGGKERIYASFKFFLYTFLGSVLMLVAMVAMFADAGTTDIEVLLAHEFASETFSLHGEVSLGLLFGLIFVISGLAFKVSAVPFHMWTPDVYEGSPTPVTAFFATAPKMAAMGLFARVLHDAFGHAVADWQQVIALLAVLSMFLGAVAAIGQRDIKRLMAYSSISHMGFALMGLAAGTEFGVQAMLIYMAIYVTMNVGTFAFILMMEKDGRPVTDITSLNLYARREPGRALAMLVLLFSLAGVPPMLGFFGKFYVLRAAYDGGLAWLAVAGVIASVIGAFYYLRIVYYMYFGEDGAELETNSSPVLWGFLMASAAVMLLGVINMFGVEGAAASAAATLLK